ncbi:hypothetical protein Gotur_022708, partial [Gossypium turneri]
IWGERNRRVHEKTNRSGKEIAFFVKRYISELNEIGAKTSQVRLRGREWKYPPVQFVKVNFDAAFDGNSWQSAAGIVAKDSDGNTLLSCREIHHHVALAFAAEAIACRTTTQIEGAYIQDIHQLLKNFGKYYLEYIPREANSLAHKLAMVTLKEKEELYLIGRVPEYAVNLEETERKAGKMY